MHVRKCISGHYFSPERGFGGGTRMCESWTGCGKRHKHMSGRSAERCESTDAGASLEGGFAAETNADGLA